MGYKITKYNYEKRGFEIMSKNSDKLEMDITNSVTVGEKSPKNLESWIINLGILPTSTVSFSQRIGSKNKNNKTDVIIGFDNGAKLKISAKLSNADYFGNWYGHKRFLEEFGEEKFDRMTNSITDWANNTWKNGNASKLFVGVSINFGKRTGNTALDFLSVFDSKDILKIVEGSHGTDSDETANCLYISDKAPIDLKDLISNLVPINLKNIESIVGDFKIACRPVNPMTEGTNRGKNVYTRFVPARKLETLTIVSSLDELNKLGTYKKIKLDANTPLNHNHILDDLRDNYNIVLPRKDSYDLFWDDSNVRIIGVNFDKSYPISEVNIKKGTKKINTDKFCQILVSTGKICD